MPVLILTTLAELSPYLGRYGESESVSSNAKRERDLPAMSSQCAVRIDQTVLADPSIENVLDSISSASFLYKSLALYLQPDPVQSDRQAGGSLQVCDFRPR